MGVMKRRLESRLTIKASKIDRQSNYGSLSRIGRLQQSYRLEWFTPKAEPVNALTRKNSE